MDIFEPSAFSSRYKMVFDFPLSGIDLKCLIEKIMLRIAAECAESGTMLIGHIKCFAETEDGSHVACSVLSAKVGAETRGEFSDGSQCVTVTQNTLVYGLPASMLRAIWASTLQNVTRSHGVYSEQE